MQVDEVGFEYVARGRLCSHEGTLRWNGMEISNLVALETRENEKKGEEEEFVVAGRHNKDNVSNKWEAGDDAKGKYYCQLSDVPCQKMAHPHFVEPCLERPTDSHRWRT